MTTVREYLLERLRLIPLLGIETRPFCDRHQTHDCRCSDHIERPDRAHRYRHLIGRRVRLTNGYDGNFPTILVDAGETGTVRIWDGESLWIQMDRHFPQLDPWNNQLQLFDHEDRAHPLSTMLELIPNPVVARHVHVYDHDGIATRDALDVAIGVLDELAGHTKMFSEEWEKLSGAIVKLHMIREQKGLSEAGLECDTAPEMIDIWVDG
jgi:hypothetical protein